MTLAIGLLGTDFGVLISDTQETFSTAQTRDGVQKLYSVGKNCAVAFADQGPNAGHVLNLAHIKDRTIPVDAMPTAELIGHAFRGYVTGHGLEPNFAAGKCPLDSSVDWQRVLPMTALVCGFDDGVPRLFVVGPHDRYAPTPAGVAMQIGITHVALEVIEAFRPRGAEAPNEALLLLLGTVAIVMTNQTNKGVNTDLQAVVVRTTGIEVVRQDCLVTLREKALGLIPSCKKLLDKTARGVKPEFEPFDGRIKWLDHRC
jgi:20S proteasome alpha/beta subunit